MSQATKPAEAEGKELRPFTAPAVMGTSNEERAFVESGTASAAKSPKEEQESIERPEYYEYYLKHRHENPRLPKPIHFSRFAASKKDRLSAAAIGVLTSLEDRPSIGTLPSTQYGASDIAPPDQLVSLSVEEQQRVDARQHRMLEVYETPEVARSVATGAHAEVTLPPVDESHSECEEGTPAAAAETKQPPMNPEEESSRSMEPEKAARCLQRRFRTYLATGAAQRTVAAIHFLLESGKENLKLDTRFSVRNDAKAPSSHPAVPPAQNIPSTGFLTACAVEYETRLHIENFTQYLVSQEEEEESKTKSKVQRMPLRVGRLPQSEVTGILKDVSETWEQAFGTNTDESESASSSGSPSLECSWQRFRTLAECCSGLGEKQTLQGHSNFAALCRLVSSNASSANDGPSPLGETPDVSEAAQISPAERIERQKKQSERDWEDIRVQAERTKTNATKHVDPALSLVPYVEPQDPTDGVSREAQPLVSGQERAAVVTAAVPGRSVQMSTQTDDDPPPTRKKKRSRLLAQSLDDDEADLFHEVDLDGIHRDDHDIMEAAATYGIGMMKHRTATPDVEEETTAQNRPPARGELWGRLGDNDVVDEALLQRSKQESLVSALIQRGTSTGGTGPSTCVVCELDDGCGVMPLLKCPCGNAVHSSCGVQKEGLGVMHCCTRCLLRTWDE